MMAKKQNLIWIVVYPNGEKATGGISPISEGHAVAGAIRHWLHDEWFGDIDYGHIWGGGALQYMWPAMKKRGWQCHEVDLDEIAP